jgi:hypothetical protein
MTDPLDTLRKLKPAPAVDPAALDHLLATVATTPPALPPRRRRFGRRRLAVATALLASGVVVAGATGMLPRPFTDALSFWDSQSNGGISAGNATRIAQQPAPGGKVLSAWSATSEDGTTCISALYEPPGPLTRPAPTDVHSAGGQCNPPDAPAEPFGNMGGSADPTGLHTMWVTAGPATRAELHLPDGTERPALTAAGYFFCWYVAAPQDETPTLIGYDANGQEVNRFSLPNTARPGG